MKRVLIAVGIMVFLLGAVGGAFGAEDVVKIGYLRLVMSLPTFVAQEKGFFAQEGIKAELIPFDSATLIIDALMSGRIDANCGSAITGHWFAAQSAMDRFKVFQLYGTTSMKEDNTFVVVVKKDSPLKDLRDLKGKRVAHFPGATNLALAKIVIRTQINPEDVTFIEMAPPNLAPALAAGQIDAFFTPEPMGMMAVSQGVGRYLMKSPLTLLKLKKGLPGGAFSFSIRFLKEEPEKAKRLKKALDRAVDYIRANEKEARPYLVAYTGLPEAVAMAVPFDKWIKLEELNKKAGQEYFDVMYKEGAYKERVDTTKLYYE